MNRKQIGLAIAVVLLVGSISGIVYGIKQVSDVVITQEEVQQKINAHLPLTEGNITINEAGVSFQSGKVNIMISAEGKKLGQPFSLTASSAIAVTYDNLSGEFVFIPNAVKVSSLKVRGKDISESVEGTIEKVGKSKRFGNWIAKLDKYVPATELRDKIVAKKAEIGEKAELKAEAMIEKSAKWLLSKTPIRPPNNLKSNVARMMLESIEIDNGKLIAHMSFWQLTKSVIAGAVLLIISLFLIGVLIIFPEIGMMFV